MAGFLSSPPAKAQSQAELLCTFSSHEAVEEKIQNIQDGLSQAEFSQTFFAAEASLAPNSFLSIIENKEKNIRSAFVGSPLASRNIVFAQEQAQLSCHTKKAKPALAPKRENKYFLCFLDEAIFSQGSVVELRRSLPAHRSAISFGQAYQLAQKNEHYQYSVWLDDRDSQRGLRIDLLDLKTKERAQVIAPAAAIRQTILFAHTQGAKELEAKMLRLACQFTDSLEILSQEP